MPPRARRRCLILDSPGDVENSARGIARWRSRGSVEPGVAYGQSTEPIELSQTLAVTSFFSNSAAVEAKWLQWPTVRGGWLIAWGETRRNDDHDRPSLASEVARLRATLVIKHASKADD